MNVRSHEIPAATFGLYTMDSLYSMRENLKSPIPADLYNNCFCPLMTFNNGNPLNHTNAISERDKAPTNEYRVRFVRPSTELSLAKKSSSYFIDTKNWIDAKLAVAAAEAAAQQLRQHQQQNRQQPRSIDFQSGSSKKRGSRSA